MQMALLVVNIIRQNMHETCRMFANLNLNVALSFLHTLKKITYKEKLDTAWELTGRGRE